jgi:transposase InsO family protein
MAKRKHRTGRSGATSGRSRAGRVGGGEARDSRAGRSYGLSFRLKAVQLVLEEGVTIERTAQLLGTAAKTIRDWVEKYRHGGLDALTPKPPKPPPRPATVAQQAKRDAVVAARSEHPEWGTRRIRDTLERFEALGVSETEVRRILHEAGLIEPAVGSNGTAEREHPARRFERAAPNQLWQSDIFTFLLRRQERVYLTAFMDDHSRFIVSYALAHHQRSPLVLEALSRGIAEYGTPEEVLTDNGRQYAAWRGETDFQRELRRFGIRHIRSRPQHPQTLGKVERFWKTLWDEFLSRGVLGLRRLRAAAGTFYRRLQFPEAAPGTLGAGAGRPFLPRRRARQRSGREERRSECAAPVARAAGEKALLPGRAPRRSRPVDRGDRQCPPSPARLRGTANHRATQGGRA